MVCLGQRPKSSRLSLISRKSKKLRTWKNVYLDPVVVTDVQCPRSDAKRRRYHAICRNYRAIRTTISYDNRHQRKILFTFISG